MGNNLGKGLSALLGDAELIYDEKLKEKELPISSLKPGKYQPRTYFSKEHLNSLSESIKKNGILQPLLVRNIEENIYEIIAGERRFKAAKLAGLDSVPVIIKNFNDHQAIEIALIENLQRQDLNPLEEANGYKRMMDEFGYTQEEVGKAVDKSRSHVANLLRLLNLPANVKKMLEDEELSMGHARALLSYENPKELADIITARNLSVRQTESLVKANNSKGKKRAIAKTEKMLEAIDIIHSITGLETDIKPSSAEKGKIVISYNSLHELEHLIKKINKK